MRVTEVRVAPEVSGHLAPVHVRKGDRKSVRGRSRGAVGGSSSVRRSNKRVRPIKAHWPTEATSTRACAARRSLIRGGGRQGPIPPGLCRPAARRASRASRATTLPLGRRSTKRRCRLPRSRRCLPRRPRTTPPRKPDTRDRNVPSPTRASPPQPRRSPCSRAGLHKTRLVAPAEGTVRVVAGEVGEAIRAGQTIVTIEATEQPWLSFNVREDRLAASASAAKSM